MLTYFVVAPILMAVFFYLFSFAKVTRIIVITAQIALLGAACYLFFITQEADVITNVGNYEGFLGITLGADSLTSVFILLTAFLFLVITIYSFHENNDRLFWFLLFLWQGLLIGVFLTRDLFNVFVLKEVATVVVAVLIMYERDNRSMYDGIIYLMVNIVVMQFYLFGIGYMYKITGVLDMDAAMYRVSVMDRALFFLPYALIMTFVALKCALLPLFSWLPKAHGTPGAPFSVSAILSGLHIKSGLYLFLRFQEIFEGIAITEFFLVIGILTAIVGVIMALAQTDVKLILAYSTIAQIGLIMTGLNIFEPYYSYTGSLYHIINHAMAKSALFLSAGMIIKTYGGVRDITKIRGVLRQNPLVGIATILAMLGMIGTPLFGGSISKYFMMTNVNWLLTSVIVFINFGTILVFMKYSQMLFGHFKFEGDVPKPDGCQQASTFALGVLCLGLGVFGEQVIGFLFGTSVSVSMAGYFEKIIIFVGSLIAGYLVYRFFVKGNGVLLAHIRRIDLGFRGICISMGVFFAMVLLAVGVLL
ncbi:MAG: proton-conducting membrane transporter [Defluviitaleaceae bacterium]|nr:proton-conducting membrane transporter [Defluviitaleaceae bacterium]